MAGKQGIEPQFTVLETVVLPLHYSPIKWDKGLHLLPDQCPLSRVPGSVSIRERVLLCFQGSSIDDLLTCLIQFCGGFSIHQPSRAMPPLTRLGSFYVSVFDSLRATTLVNPDTVVLMASSISNRFFRYVICSVPLAFLILIITQLMILSTIYCKLFYKV